ncbi:MAG: protein-L-isoaspartate(D-aspartate) O-methyltransferase [bacterium]|nr:protein-L-isoaspartate(D-aspartate) O-methyltransferase [bacterium]
MQEQQETEFTRKRLEMVHSQIVMRGISDQNVIRAMKEVPRHRFVPIQFEEDAYEDTPLSIGYEQTISQPYIVAYMLEKLELQPNHKVLEVGSGSGYVVALLSQIVKEVHGVEIIAELVNRSKFTLQTLGYQNAYIHLGNGRNGLPQFAPFDAILISAASADLPSALTEQLRIGGHIIYPLQKNGFQYLELGIKQQNRLEKKLLVAVRFVPLVNNST